MIAGIISITAVLILTACSGGGRNRSTDEHGTMNIALGEGRMARNGTDPIAHSQAD